MNTLISFEIAKLLKEKGFDNIDCNGYYHVCDGYTKGYAHCYSSSYTQSDNAILAPSIAEVVMWLYDKHKIWVIVNITINAKWFFELYNLKDKRNAEILTDNEYWFNSPTEAYEAAIKYTLENLI
jgi:hypothetical protein